MVSDLYKETLALLERIRPFIQGACIDPMDDEELKLAESVRDEMNVLEKKLRDDD